MEENIINQYAEHSDRELLLILLGRTAKLEAFVDMMTTGARNAMGQPGMAGVAARAMMPPHLQAAVMNGHAPDSIMLPGAED